MRALFFACAILFLGTVLVPAQGEKPKGGNGSEQRYDYAELLKAPEKARLRRSPLEADETAAVAGKKLFERHCAECHGPTGDGGKKAPSLNAREVQGATPGTLFWLLTNGVVRRGMPVWSKLPEAQRWQLVRYLQTLKTDTPPAPATETK
jgi:mono/diheme cytochrome c family protein